MATPVGGAQSAHNASDSVNGRNQTIPAIPAVNGGAASGQEHSRKPSMTVTPAGANFNPNGSAAPAPQNKPNVQFGSMSAQGGSPAPGNPAIAHQSNNSLGVNQLNPNQRAASPQGSPSPIPQPREMSGGRPPSTYGSQGNGMVFGQQGDQNDPSVCSPSTIRHRCTHLEQGQPRPVSSLQFGNRLTRCRAIWAARPLVLATETLAVLPAVVVEHILLTTMDSRCHTHHTTRIVASPMAAECHLATAVVVKLSLATLEAPQPWAPEARP
jgi:hypothetical protein